MTRFESPSFVSWRLGRRDWLRSSCAGAFGLTGVLSGARRLSAAVETESRRAKSVILVMCPGGPGQHDTFDPKPHAPDGIRGEFSPIATALPGVHFCEHLPRLAARARQFAVVRSMSHREANHFPATHKILTGHTMPFQQPGDAVNKQSRHDWPCYAAAYDAIFSRTDGIPNGVALPYPLIGGGIPWPGQYGGFLGPAHDPWQLNQDPNAPGFREETLSFPAGVSLERFELRRGLLEQLEGPRQRLDAAAAAFGDQQATAANLLTSGRVAAAFDMERESDQTRDLYGRHLFGQSLLLSRRLVEAGVPMIQANMGAVQTWDTHENNFPRMRDELLPRLDMALSALLDDLSTRGLLAETLVIVAGEFGRTPNISLVAGAAVPGRNHWPQVYSVLFAGGGVLGGQVIGASDAIGGEPVTRSYSPDDLGTTLLSALGVSAEAEVHDPLGRPQRLLGGEVIEPLYTGG